MIGCWRNASKLLSLFVGRVKKPSMYCCYVHDTFAIFDSENDSNEFLHQLNSLHPFLWFTFKKRS